MKFILSEILVLLYVVQYGSSQLSNLFNLRNIDPSEGKGYDLFYFDGTSLRDEKWRFDEENQDTVVNRRLGIRNDETNQFQFVESISDGNGFRVKSSLMSIIPSFADLINNRVAEPILRFPQLRSPGYKQNEKYGLGVNRPNFRTTARPQGTGVQFGFGNKFKTHQSNLSPTQKPATSLPPFPSIPAKFNIPAADSGLPASLISMQPPYNKKPEQPGIMEVPNNIFLNQLSEEFKSGKPAFKSQPDIEASEIDSSDLIQFPGDETRGNNNNLQNKLLNDKPTSVPTNQDNSIVFIDEQQTATVVPPKTSTSSTVVKRPVFIGLDDEDETGAVNGTDTTQDAFVIDNKINPNAIKSLIG